MLKIIAIASIMAAPLISQADEGTDIHAAQQIRICKNQPIPPSYVIIAQGDSANCPKPLHNNSWYIKKPSQTGQTTVCKVSPIPAGYAITGEGNAAQCPGELPKAYYIRYAPSDTRHGDSARYARALTHAVPFRATASVKETTS